MNYFIVFTLLVTIAVAVIAKPANDKYTTKYDNVNVDDILGNDRLLNGYVKCLLDKGGCTPDATELKKVLPDALNTECSMCSENQKKNSRKVLVFLIDNKPDIWTELAKTYDPSGDYKKKYCEVAKNEGTKIKSCT